jgi:hypothetical protein
MFHQIPLHPSIQKYFAYCYLGVIWTCLRAPFGGTSMPAFANLLAGVTAMMLLARGIHSVWMTDDSLYQGQDMHTCLAALHTAINIMERLGWIVNLSKVEGPAQILAFLGIVIDSVQQTLGISAVRLASLIDRLDTTLAVPLPTVTVRDIQSIAGRLQWVAAVFPAGRPYMAALYTDAKGQPDDRCTLSTQSISDLQWWRAHLHQLWSQASTSDSQAAWTRYSYDPIPAPLRIFSDASGDMSLGFGLIYDHTLIRGSWSMPHHKSSSYLEYIPLLYLLRTYGHQLKGKIIICHTDNASNAIALTRGSTLAPTCREIFREIHSLACKHHIILLGDWCPREFLMLPDAVSKHKVMM